MWVGVPWKGAFMREEHSFTYPSVSMWELKLYVPHKMVVDLPNGRNYIMYNGMCLFGSACLLEKVSLP
jgi:hypothetical protein